MSVKGATFETGSDTVGKKIVSLLSRVKSFVGVAKCDTIRNKIFK